MELRRKDLGSYTSKQHIVGYSPLDDVEADTFFDHNFIGLGREKSIKIKSAFYLISSPAVACHSLSSYHWTFIDRYNAGSTGAAKMSTHSVRYRYLLHNKPWNFSFKFDSFDPAGENTCHDRMSFVKSYILIKIPLKTQKG